MAGFLRSPGAQSYDCCLEQSGCQPLREDNSFVKRWFLVHDPTIIRGERLVIDARGDSLSSRQMAQCRRVSCYPVLTAEIHCVLSSPHSSVTDRHSASLNKPSSGSASDLKAVAMLTNSASHVEDAVLP